MIHRQMHHRKTFYWPGRFRIARQPQTPNEQRAVLARNVLDAIANNHMAVDICEKLLLKQLRESGVIAVAVSAYVEYGCIEHDVVHVWTNTGWLEINPDTGEVTKC